MKSLVTGGSATRRACGATTCRTACQRPSPSTRAASICVRRHGEQPRAVVLGLGRRVVEPQREPARDQRAQPQPELGEPVVDDDELQQQRRAAEELDVPQRERGERRRPVHAAPAPAPRRAPSPAPSTRATGRASPARRARGRESTGRTLRRSTSPARTARARTRAPPASRSARCSTPSTRPASSVHSPQRCSSTGSVPSRTSVLQSRVHLVPEPPVAGPGHHRVANLAESRRQASSARAARRSRARWAHRAARRRSAPAPGRGRDPPARRRRCERRRRPRGASARPASPGSVPTRRPARSASVAGARGSLRRTVSRSGPAQ